MRRDEYVGPGTMTGKPPMLDEVRTTPSRASKPAGTPPRARPAVKLAPLPAAEPPRPGKAKTGEPPAQKPDMKLPADAMRASKSGSKPLAAHLRRHEDALETARRGKGKDVVAAARGSQARPRPPGRQGQDR